jgi:IclR family KDG regulon transcriptional repressor
MLNKNVTVVKSMEILNLFLTHTRLSLNEIVQLSGLPKTSIHRMLGSLEAMAFLEKDLDGKYALGLLFLQFGQLVSERLDIRHTAYPLMKALGDEIGEAVNLIIRDGNEGIYIEKIDSTKPVRVYTQIGRKSPLYAGACPRILLAYLPEQEIDAYLHDTELKPIASGTIISREQLLLALKESKQSGYSVSHSELEDYTSAVAAPIFDITGRVVAGLSIAGPAMRFGHQQLPELISKVKQTAAHISNKLGWSPTK